MAVGGTTPSPSSPCPTRLPERNEGLWQRPETDPLVIHTHTEGDYWARHVSLTHTDPRDASDVEIPEYARMYQLTGAPHMVRALDDPIWIGQLTPNAISAMPYRRAVLVLLDGGRRTARRHRRRCCQRQRTARWSRPRRCSPSIPSSRASTCQKGDSRLPRYNYGPDFDSRGIMSVFPPQPFPGQEYPLRVPADRRRWQHDCRPALPGHRGAAGYVQRLVAAQGRLLPRASSGGTRAASCRSPARRPSASLAVTPAPRSRSATRATQAYIAAGDAGVRGTRARGPDAAGGRRPLHHRGAAEEPARCFCPARTADSGGRLHRPLVLRTANCPRQFGGGLRIIHKGGRR